MICRRGRPKEHFAAKRRFPDEVSTGGKIMFKGSVVALIVGFGLVSGAQAGCLSGAAAGAVVGHLAGHHAVAGAAVGCAVGHHSASKDKQTNPSNQNPSSQNSSH